MVNKNRVKAGSLLDEWLEQQLKKIESQIKEAITVNQDWQMKLKLLTSVPGVGEVVAITLTRAFPSELKIRGVARQFYLCQNSVRFPINLFPTW